MKTKFSIHPLFFVFLFLFVYQGLFVLLISYLITIFLHELAHFFVAKKLGYDLNKFTLMPHGISLSGQNQLFSTKDEILIAIAGPVFNFVLAILCVAVWWLFPSTYVVTNVFVWSNVCTGLFNFLPVFPLDGGRVYLALLSKKMSRSKALHVLRICGVIVSMLLLAVFVLTTFFIPNFSFLVLGIFCFVTALWEDKTSIYQKTNFLDGKQNALKHGIVVREIAVDEDMTIYKLLRHLRPNSITNFKVLKKDLTVVGTIKEGQIEKIIEIYPANTTLKTIFH